MALGGGRGLTSVDAQRWLRGLRLFRVERLLLTLIFLVLAAVSFLVLGDVGCTAADPRVCGPSLPGTWALALAFATPILLFFAPALGCLSAVGLAVLGARYDPGPVSHGWWAAGGILSVALLAHLTLIRVRQHRIAVACTERLPLQGPVDSATRTSRPLRLWFIGVALLTGIALMQVYQGRVSAKQDHLRHARQLAAVVQALDDSSFTVDLSVPGVAELVTVDVVSTGDYRVGQEVPVVADLTGTSPWVRLVAEPEDPTAWLSFAILALLLAGAAAIRAAQTWRAHRRLIDAELGLPVSLRWPMSSAEVYPRDGSGLSISTLRRTVESAGQPGSSDRDRDRSQPLQAYLIGQLWYGGIVHVMSVNGWEGTDALMGLPPLTRGPASTVATEPFGFARSDASFAAAGAFADEPPGDRAATGGSAGSRGRPRAEAERAANVARDIDAVVFKNPPIGKRGYDEDEVDAFLSRLIAAFRGAGPPVTSHEVHNVVFSKPPIDKRGYDQEEVDAFLDRMEIECERHWPSPGPRPRIEQ